MKSDYKKLFYDTFYYLNILIELNDKLIKIKYTKFPRKFDFYTSHNTLIGTNFNLIKRILLIRKTYKIFKKIDITEGN
jgi:hypothetical protein